MTETDGRPIHLGSEAGTAGDLRGALLAVPTAIVVVGADGVVRFAYPAADALFAPTDVTVVGASFGLPLGGPGHRAEIELRTGGAPVSVEMHVERCSWGGEPASVVVFTDVTARVRSERRLRTINERLALAAAGAGDAVFDWDLTTGQFHATGGWGMLGSSLASSGADPEEWLGRVHPDDRIALDHALGDHLYGSATLVRHDHRLRTEEGAYRWVSLRARATFEDGTPRRLSGVMTDIEEQRAREESFRHAALHDPLTGLANRSLLLDRMSHAAQRAVWEPRRRYAVLLIDLDGFKAVNDEHGHAAGDALLVEVAKRMRAAVRPADTVARLGGDEFAILVDSFVETSAVEALTQRLRRAIEQPVEVNGSSTSVTASIGAAISSQKPKDISDLLARADAAMYRAKTVGGNRVEVDEV